MAGQSIDDPAALRDELDHQRCQLERLEDLLEVIRDVDRAAAGASSREELEAAVCEELGEDHYTFAWIAELDPATKELRPRATSCEDDDYLEKIRLALGDEETGRGPACRAFETGEVNVVQDIEDDPTFAYPETAIERGFASMVSIPLRYDGSDYGVLSVYSSVPDAFDGRELDVLGELGETIGLAISALVRRRALLADSVLEVELSFESAEHALVSATGELGGRSELLGIVWRTADEYVFYHHVTGVDPATLAARVTEHEKVLDGHVVTDDGGEGLVYWVVKGPSISSTLGDFGGRMTSFEVEDGVARVVGVLPHGTDLRAVVDALGRWSSEAELMAQRTRDRPDHSEQRFRMEVTERLTDRQLATLRAAYFSGYHDRPRTSSGEEVAETLGISPSTFHQHHRVGVRKLLGAAFEPHGPDDG